MQPSKIIINFNHPIKKIKDIEYQRDQDKRKYINFTFIKQLDYVKKITRNAIILFL
jgi:hypothetical protein